MPILNRLRVPCVLLPWVFENLRDVESNTAAGVSRMDGIDRLRRQLEELHLSEAQIHAVVDAVQELVEKTMAKTMAQADGELYCSTEEVLMCAHWERYTREDFLQLRRDWSEFSRRLPQDGELFQFYSTTRNMAYEANTYASHFKSSSLISTINGVKPVRLCAFPKSEDHSDKAYLCPKT